MNFTALDIIHFWTDSRGKLIQKVLPTNKKIFVYCTDDLSSEATKVCNFLNLILKQPWTFQIKNENEKFVITFLPETVTLDNLFQTEQHHGVIKKTPRKERERGG
jgi:hypothetical protein